MGKKKSVVRVPSRGKNCVAESGDSAYKAETVGAQSLRPNERDTKRAQGTALLQRSSSLVDTRVIYCGDNLEQLKKLPDACVDLIYIDPPFPAQAGSRARDNSNRNYEVFWGETKEKRAFEDRHASTQAYPALAGRLRCVELHRVLKPTGSFYYHCDWHASHYVKVMLDQIFWENNFLVRIFRIC